MKEIRHSMVVRVIDAAPHQQGNGYVLHILPDGQAFVQFDLYYKTYIHTNRLMAVEV